MRWELEPGHSAAEFRARHMMVTWVRGAFKDIHGTVTFDPTTCADLGIDLTIEADKLWSGEPARDAHLRTADFFDIENHPTITFKSTKSVRSGAKDYLVSGDLAIRGKKKPVTLVVTFQGSWKTPFGPDKTVTRLGFTGKTTVNRQDFGVSWNDTMENDGNVVGDDIEVTLDLEALST